MGSGIIQPVVRERGAGKRGKVRLWVDRFVGLHANKPGNQGNWMQKSEKVALRVDVIQEKVALWVVRILCGTPNIVVFA